MPLTSSSAEDFVSQPAGRCLLDRHWLYAGIHDRLHVCTLWGELSQTDLVSLVVILVAMLEPAIPRHATIVDLSRMTAADEEAFRSLTAYVDANRLRLAEQIERVAIIPPAGLFGAATRGFFASVEPPYEVKVLTMPAALTWLDQDADVLIELEATRAAATGPALLRDLRLLMTAQPGVLTLPAAARALGLSSRALQRTLRDNGTTFRTEQNAQQMRAAEQLLLKGLSISQIAYAIGCASPAHFSVLFRRWTGQTPTSWRAARTGATPHGDG